MLGHKLGRPRKEPTMNDDLFYVSGSFNGEKGEGSSNISKRPENYKLSVGSSLICGRR